MQKFHEFLRELFPILLGLGAAAGVAAVVHTTKGWPRWPVLVAAGLYSAVGSVICGFLLYGYLETNPCLLVGLSVLAGIGGSDILILIARFVVRGVNLDIKLREGDAEKPLGTETKP
jgi:ABC-type thiamin/hydroxymethylpyrimidine transport system permease subunit